MDSEFDTGTLNERAVAMVAAVAQRNRLLDASVRVEKFCQMASAPLVFFRCTDYLFWQDLAADPRQHEFGNAQTRTWVQGDLHIYKFGSTHDAKGKVGYGLSDFDEAVFSDYQFDLWRMAVSLVLLARQNDDLSTGQQQRVVDAFVQTYLHTLRGCRQRAFLKAARFTRESTYGDLSHFLARVEAQYSRQGMLDRWAPLVHAGKGGSRRKLSGNPLRRFDLAGRPDKLGEASRGERDMIERAMAGYRKSVQGSRAGQGGFFHVQDVARRFAAGTSTLGVPRYYVLVSGDRRDEFRLLDVKQQTTPAPYEFLDQMASDEYRRAFGRNDALRYATAGRALTARTDPHLGWMELDDGFYSVRERSPWKEAFPGEVLATRSAFTAMAEQWAEVTATAHAQANKMLPQRVHELTAGRDLDFCALVREIAFNYADEVETDHRAFRRALALPVGTCTGKAFAPPLYRDLLPR